MTDHAHELRRYARKIAHPAGDVPAVMRAAAAEIERMQAKIEAAEKEVAHIKEVEFPRKARAVAAGWETKCARLEQERDALRAKIEAMERQEPVATVRINAINGNPSVDFVPGHHYLHHNDRLYLAPGAQPAPSVPDGWKEAAIAWEVYASIHREYGKGKDPFFNTRQGDFVKHANDARAMLATAPEAKP